jgi:hypothetical protein
MKRCTLTVHAAYTFPPASLHAAEGDEQITLVGSVDGGTELAANEGIINS